METVLSILAWTIIAIPFGAIAIGIVQGSPTWEMEDPPYVFKPVREVDRKQPTPLQMPDPAVIRWERESLKRLQSSAMIHRETTSVHNVMEKQAHYCREDQSVDDARRIMREHDLQYLLVLDRNMRIVGMVRMRDLGDEERPQSA
jgi:hypothetical protein